MADDLTQPEIALRPEAAVTRVRAAQRRRRRQRVLGVALIVYGLVGVLLFAVLALSIGQPIARVAALAASIDQERALAIQALDDASTALSQASAGVGNMDNSLRQVQTATSQAASISRTVGTNMADLSESMKLTVLGFQPFLGLSGGFANAGSQLQVLSDDIYGIGSSLADNRRDADNVGKSLNDLSLTVAQLSASMNASPSLTFNDGSVSMLTFGVLAVALWLIVLALGCVGAGGWLLWSARAP